MGINRLPQSDVLDRLHATLREAEANARREGLTDVELLVGAAAEAAQQYLKAWEQRQPIAA